MLSQVAMKNVNTKGRLHAPFFREFHMHDEAVHVVALIQKHLTPEKTKELVIALDDQIGRTSEDQTVKKLFADARMIVDPPIEIPFYLWPAFVMLVIIHMVLVIGVIVSFCVLPFMTPWYIALPLMTFIWFFSTSRVECKLTNLENDLRVRLGKKRIGGFVGHYLVKPIKLYLWKRNGRTR